MDFHSDLDVRECDNVREELQPYLLSQYSASPTIAKLLKDFSENIDPQADKELFMQKMMDIDTADGIGLDVWGNILNIGRTIELGNTLVTLDDSHYRKILKYKALANITEATTATLNKMLAILFEDIDAIVYNITIPATSGDDTYNSYPMHVRYILNGSVSTLDTALFELAGTLSLGAGVGFEVLTVGDDTFGFAGSGLQPFNQGTFAYVGGAS